MGTSIDVLFARPIDVTPAELSSRLTTSFHNVSHDLDTIRANAWYRLEDVDWEIQPVAEYDGEPAYLFSDGPCSFDASIYANVILISHPERFARAHLAESPVASALQHVIEHAVISLIGVADFAVVAGGYGESDHAIDSAYYNNADYDAVIAGLVGFLGEPCESWAALNDTETRGWLKRSASVR